MKNKDLRKMVKRRNVVINILTAYKKSANWTIGMLVRTLQKARLRNTHYSTAFSRLQNELAEIQGATPSMCCSCSCSPKTGDQPVTQ